MAYYTIAIKAIKLGTDISKTLHKKLEGVSIHSNIIPFYLIGQLGRNNKYTSVELSGKTILSYIFDTIDKVHTIIGGRLILAECKDVPQLRSFYENNGFTYFQNDLSNDCPLIQYIKFINS